MKLQGSMKENYLVLIEALKSEYRCKNEEAFYIVSLLERLPETSCWKLSNTATDLQVLVQEREMVIDILLMYWKTFAMDR